MKQKTSLATNVSCEKQFINKLLQLMNDLIHVTHQLKISVYKIINIPVQGISFKVRNDQSSILTNIKSIYFDIHRIQSIIAKNKNKNYVDQIGSRNVKMAEMSFLKNHIVNNREIGFHSQIGIQDNLIDNMSKDLNRTIKYYGNTKHKSSKSQFFNKNEIKINIKGTNNYKNVNDEFVNCQNNFQQKIMKLSKELNTEHKPLTSSNNFAFTNNQIKRSKSSINVQDLEDQQLRSSLNSNRIIQKIRKNRKQLLQYVRQKQKRCLNHINNICQSSSVIISKKGIQFKGISKQNINPADENQRKLLKNKLQKQLQQI